MSKPSNRYIDPVKRAEKRRRQREAQAKGANPSKRASVPAQMDHARSGRARKKAREGEERIERERGQP